MSSSKPSDKIDNSDELKHLQRQLFVIVLVSIIGIVAVQVCSYFADVLRVLGISILFAYLFVAVVDWLNRYLKFRILAVSIVYGVVLIGIIFGAITVVPTLITQVSQLLNSIYDQLPHFVQSTAQAMLPLEKHLHAAHIEIKSINLVQDFVSFLPKVEAQQIFSHVGDVAVSTVTWTAYCLSVLLLSFYFLLDGPKMEKAIVQMFPQRHRQRLHSISKEIDQSLHIFFKGQVVLAFGFGIVITMIFYALGVHYALLLGLILAIFEVIPVIGPTVGLIPTVFSVVFDGMDNIPGNRFTELLLILAIFSALQWAKDNLVAPKYMGNAIGIHPVLIFLAIMIGAKIDGLLGIIFAIPAACVLQVLAKEIADVLANNHAEIVD